MQELATAKIRGTFGVSGQVKIESFSGEYDHLVELTEVFIHVPKNKSGGQDARDGLYVVEDLTIRRTDALLKLRGIDTPEKARLLNGAELVVPRDRASPLYEGEFYVTDLCTSVLVYEDIPIGRITGVVEGGGGWLLEVSEAAGGRTLFVPFNAEFVGAVDTTARTVELMHRWIIE